jgi:hypothetical protein
MSQTISAQGVSESLARQTLTADNDLTSLPGNAIPTALLISRINSAAADQEALNQIFIVEALNTVAESITDTIRELVDDIRQILDEHEQANRIHFDYQAGKIVLDGFSNLIYAAYRKPKRRR